ncbi:MAG: DUF6982 domain-containing protein [Terriglobales bacterium]
MPTPPLRIGRPSKVVVACLDGQRRKGYIFNFSPARTQFRLFPEEMSPHVAGIEIKLETVKAVFFVKEFAGHAEHHDQYELKPGAHGRKLEVIFQDGETIAGTTEAYHAEHIGFFIVPADPGSNNSRIFVVNKTVREVKPL